MGLRRGRGSVSHIAISAVFLFALALQPLSQVFTTPVHAVEAAPAQPGQVVINELSANPSTDGREWVELYNSTDHSVSLQGWRVVVAQSGEVFGNVIANRTIAAHGFLVVEARANNELPQQEATTLNLQTDPAAEGGTVIMHQLQYSPMPTSKSFGLVRDGLSDAARVLEYPTKGEANNDRCKDVSEPACVTPEVPVLTLANNAIVNGVPARYTWSASDHAHHYIFASYDDADMKQLHERQEVTSPLFERFEQHESVVWWRVKAVSDAGKESDWSEARRVIVDNEAPTVENVTEGDTSTVSGVANFRFKIADNYPDKVVAAMDGAHMQDIEALRTPVTDGPEAGTASQHVTLNVTVAIDTTTLANGPHTLSVKALDHAGNVSATIQVAFVVQNAEATTPALPNDKPLDIMQMVPMQQEPLIAPILGGEHIATPEEKSSRAGHTGEVARQVEAAPHPIVDATNDLPEESPNKAATGANLPMWLGLGAVASGAGWWAFSGRKRF